MKKVFVGIDLGGTNIKIGCFDSEIRLICKTSTPTEAEMGPKVVIERIAETIEKLLRDGGFSFKDVAAVGLGCPGPARYREGIIESATNLPKFKNTPIRQMLKDRMGKPVVFENDANAARNARITHVLKVRQCLLNSRVRLLDRGPTRVLREPVSARTPGGVQIAHRHVVQQDVVQTVGGQLAAHQMRVRIHQRQFRQPLFKSL